MFEDPNFQNSTFDLGYIDQLVEEGCDFDVQGDIILLQQRQVQEGCDFEVEGSG